LTVNKAQGRDATDAIFKGKGWIVGGYLGFQSCKRPAGENEQGDSY